MQKWKYRIEEIRDIPGYIDGDSYGNSRQMTKYCKDKGWELVSVDGGIAYFKRPLQEETIPIKLDPFFLLPK